MNGAHYEARIEALEEQLGVAKHLLAEAYAKIAALSKRNAETLQKLVRASRKERNA